MQATPSCVNSVTALADQVLRESEEARERLRDDREAFYRLVTEANAEARKAAAAEAELRSREALDAVRAVRPEAAVIPAPVTVPGESDAAERLEQRELVLTYMAWLTMLARAGDAWVFQAEPGFDEEAGPVIHIHSGPFDQIGSGWTLVATLDNGKTLQTRLTEGQRGRVRVGVPGLDPKSQIRRLEIRDALNHPLYLGLGYTLQTEPWQPESELLEAAVDDYLDR